MKIQGRLHRLALRLGNNPRLALIKMIQGGLIFAFGILMIMVSNQVLSDSIPQELIALIGLIISGGGVLWTLVGYLSMSILRLYHIMSKKD